jgi:hypothetical protein
MVAAATPNMSDAPPSGSDRVEQAHDDQREPRLEVGVFQQLAIGVEDVSQRAIALPGIQSRRLEQPLDFLSCLRPVRRSPGPRWRSTSLMPRHDSAEADGQQGGYDRHEPGWRNWQTHGT